MCFVPQGRRALSTQAQDDQRPIEATEAYSSCPEGPKTTLGLLSNKVDLMASAVGRYPEASRVLSRCTLGRTLSMQPTVGSRPGASMYMPQQRHCLSVLIPCQTVQKFFLEHQPSTTSQSASEIGPSGPSSLLAWPTGLPCPPLAQASLEWS